MAFAANTNDAKAGHTYYVYGTNYTIVDGKAVAKAGTEQKDIDKYVKVIAAPTCTTKGKVELTCKTDLPDGVACDQVKTEEIDVLSHSYERVNMSLEDYATQRVAQAKGAPGRFENEGTAKAWVKEKKAGKVCYVYANRCKSCGEVTNYGTTGTLSNPVKHGYDKETTKLSCAEKVQCSNVGCNEMVAVAEADRIPSHDLDEKITTTKTGCDGITVTKQACKKCDYVKVTENGSANCVEFKGEIAASAVKTKTTISANEHEKTQVFLVDGKTIAKNVWTRENDTAPWGDAVFTVEPGYKYDSENELFIKADTTVDVNGTEKYGYTCKHCGYVTVGGPVTAPACVHAWTKVTVDATCTEAAKEYMVCTECGSYKRVGDADDVTRTSKAEATEDVKDSKKLGHNYVATKVDGDCHDTDKYTIKCTREHCPDSVKADVTRENYSTLDKGTSLYLVPTDGRVVEDNVVGSQELPYIADNTANNHKFTKKVTLKAATCTNNELVGYVCDTCGKINIHSAVVVPSSKLAHNFVKTEVAATCGEAGYSFEQCSVCKGYKNGNTTSKELVDACKTEIKPVVKDGAKCTFDKWVVTKKPTVFEKGVEALECSVCGADGEHRTSIDKLTVAKASNTVKAGKKSFSVQSSAANATGYRVYYKKAGAKSWKSYTKKTDSLSKTFSKLSKGKYYVKVKAYAKNYAGDGEVVWGATSSTKTVKVK